VGGSLPPPEMESEFTWTSRSFNHDLPGPFSSIDETKEDILDSFDYSPDNETLDIRVVKYFSPEEYSDVFDMDDR
jgi:hypothetical protein